MRKIDTIPSQVNILMGLVLIPQNAFFLLLFFIIVVPKIPIISTGFATSIRLEDFLIAYLWVLLGIYTLSGKIKIFKNMIFFWMGLYLLWGLISIVLGIFRGDVTTFLFYLRKIEYMSSFLFAYIVINKKNISEFYKLVFISFGIVALVGFLQHSKVLDTFGVTQKLIPYLQPANLRFWGSSSSLICSTFAGNYDLGGYLILVTPFFLLLLLDNAYANKRMVLLFFLCSMILIFLSGARTPTIIISGIVLVIFAKRIFFGLKKQMFKSFILFSALILIGFATWQIILTNFLARMGSLQAFNYEGIVQFFQTDQSMGFRAVKWSITWNSFIAHPLLGIGVGGFSEHFIGADGQHIQTLGETGLIGFFLFFALFFFVLKMNNNTLRYLKGMPPGKTKQLNTNFLVGLSIAILGLTLNGITINIFDSSKVAMCLWAFIGVAAKLNGSYRTRLVHTMVEHQEEGPLQKESLAIEHCYIGTCHLEK